MYTFAAALPMPDEDDFLDCRRWQAMLDQASDATGEIAADTCIGLLRKEAFSAGKGDLVILRREVSGMRALIREYSGEPGAELALLLVIDASVVETLQTRGLAAMRALVRQAKVQPYILRTMAQLEAAGLEDLIEDLGLTFPTH